MKSFGDELESVAISSVYDAGSNASLHHQSQESSDDDQDSGSEFSDEGYQAFREEREGERRRTAGR